MLGLTFNLFVVILTLWFFWRKKKLSLWKSLNIPGPEPNIFFGNLWQLYGNDSKECQRKWIEKYGKVMGYYFGLRPVLLVSDVDLLKTILQKDFQKFTNRPEIFQIGKSSTDYNKHSLTALGGKRWKDIRSVVTPTFTTSKLKMMSSIINQCVDELIDTVGKEASKGKPFNIYRVYQRLTMDVIARSALGVHSNAQKDEKEPLLRIARTIFSPGMSYLALLAFSFPELMFIFSFLRRCILRLGNEGKEPRQEIQESTNQVIAARRANPTLRRKDALQLLMDAQTDQNVSDKNLTAGEQEEPIENGEIKEVSKTGKKLTDDEVAQNAAVFLLAGYETTSTALAFVTHLLIHHPDSQQKIRDEVSQFLTKEGELDYETIQKCSYLDSVLNEALRMYPPILYFVNREPVEDVIYGDIKIPKKTTVQVPVYNIQHDPSLWENPYQFDPERFSPENKGSIHPMAFQAFGAGPRNCVGMRFALLEAKMAIAKLLINFKLIAPEGSREDNLEVDDTLVILRPSTKGVSVLAKKIS